MTENAEATKNPRTAEQAEIERLKNVCEVWEARATRAREESIRHYNQVTKQNETISMLRFEIDAHKDHISKHHERDTQRSLELALANTKVTSYSTLLALLTDAGRLSPDLMDQVDAGISAIHESSREMIQELKDFPSKALSLLDQLIGDDDDESDSSDEEFERAMSDEAEGKTFEQTESGLPKREPGTHFTQPGNDQGESDQDAPWNQ